MASVAVTAADRPRASDALPGHPDEVCHRRPERAQPSPEPASVVPVRIQPEHQVISTAADPAKFSGSVWRTEVLERARDDGLRGHRFVYAPGARSHWHVHTGEQALVVVAGRGLICWEGLDSPRPLHPGDWVHVSPGVPHWHGAAADTVFVHLAVTASGVTEWGEEARDAE